MNEKGWTIFLLLCVVAVAVIAAPPPPQRDLFDISYQVMEYNAETDISTVYMPKYSQNTDVEYHLPDDMIKRAETGLPFGTMVIQDESGQLITISGGGGGMGKPIYYELSGMMYGPQNYVPTYRDSMNLRRGVAATGAAETAAYPTPHFVETAAAVAPR